MDKLRRNSAAKVIIAFLLAVTTTFSVVAGGIVILLAADHGLFAMGYDAYENRLMESVVYNQQAEAWNKHAYWKDDGTLDFSYTEEQSEYPGIQFVLEDSNGKVIHDDRSKNEEYVKVAEYKNWAEEENVGMTYTMTAYILKDVQEGTIPDRVQKAAHFTYDNKTALAAWPAIAAILSLLLFVFLMFGAGRRKEDDEIHLRWIDRKYADAYFAASGAVIAGLFAAVIGVSGQSITGGLICAAVAGFIICLIATAFLMSAAVQAKNHTLLKNMLIVKAGSFLCRALGRFIHAIPSIWKVLVAAGLILLVNLILTSDSTESGIVLIASIILFIIIACMGINYSKVLKGAEKISEGDDEYRIETNRMVGSVKDHAENLNSINEAVSKAVDEKMKSERFKTELITNVSHDIKTPLTSIINYSQLLKKHAEEAGADDVSKEYIDVIDQNAMRLKKLAVDIVEASKASTGNVKVELRKLDLGMLVSQAMGEYEGRLEEAGMIPAASIQEGLMVNADGKHLWRIIDNILSNICKYGQENTRVYIDVKRNGEKAEAVFKNVSKYELNITAEELMERFVRGDESRNTEGSGLGLAIASDLTKMQDGNLDIQIDGDLFKVSIIFDAE